MLSIFRFKTTTAPILSGIFCLLALTCGRAQSQPEVARSVSDTVTASPAAPSERPERLPRNRRQANKAAAADTVTTPARFPSLTLFEAEIDLDSLLMQADTVPPAPDTVMPLGEILRRITHDEALDSLLQKRLAHYKQHPTQGYSVLFFSASGNHSGVAAEQADEFFQFLYPDTPTYLSYDAPYYKLKAGNFRTRLEASAFLTQIRNDYPNAFVVRDVLDIKHLLHMEEPDPVPEPADGETETVPTETDEPVLEF